MRGSALEGGSDIAMGSVKGWRGGGLVNWVSLAVFGEYAQELQKIRLQRNSCAESLSKVFGLYLKDKEDGTVLCVK